MQYYYVRNWRRFQHYKHRNPPWVKLQTNIFESTDWVLLPDRGKLLIVMCILVAAKHDGKIPKNAEYFKRICSLSRKPNFKPLIECGFLSETLADASNMRTNATTENRAQRTEIESSKSLDFKNGKTEKKTKPRHRQRTKDGRLIWLDRDSEEWEQYAADYAAAHSGLLPETKWNNSGTWFNSNGELTNRK